ncbi:hypothetical protein HHI36_020878 [Cryptolaemus montrouzieri]|uniref:Mismatch repair endonuclease PMS2 n=1 Tax=Cryptolaemus montrouzieri TaxID=559131 RepID=A0ABD2NC64_9CUCU
MKNLKREFNKMCQLLYAYCLVSKGIKFTCNNTTNKGNKNVVVATQGLNKVKENIISVFGAKQISTLIDIEVVKPDQNVLDEFNIKLNPTEELPFDLEFIISSVTHGNGRSTTDRQFFYVNSRPVEPTKIIKLVNQIYKQFNVNQCPFVYLNILLKKSIVDINVTPDKRQIFLENEKLFLATIKTSLLEAFKLFPSRLPVENKDISDFFSTSNNHERKGIKRSLTDTEQMKKGYLDSFRKKSKSDNSINVGKKDYSSLELDESLRIKKEEKVETTFLEVPSCRLEKHRESHVDTVSSVIEDKSPVKLIKSLEDDETSRKITKVCKDEASSPEESTIKQNVDIPEIEIVLDAPSNNHVNRKKVHLDITLNDIRESFDFTKSEEALSQFKVKFHSTISPENNEKAEEELQKQLSKKDFSDMEIIGQFNLGFIITRLSNDLFIVDQHATDEKYNFEQLQATTVLQKQNLVNPKPMELTAGNESILIENEEIFRKNGFHFKIDKTAASTKRILLTAVPVIQNLVFGKDDIDEMLFMLKDASHTMCRPSRVRTLLASKACRKSVMVGKSLSPKDMKQLVEHMGEIEQPWNCPHGRPTIRHLINLSLLKKDDD